MIAKNWIHVARHEESGVFRLTDILAQGEVSEYQSTEVAKAEAVKHTLSTGRGQVVPCTPPAVKGNGRPIYLRRVK